MYFKNFKTKSKFTQTNSRSSGDDIIFPEFPMQEHVKILVNSSQATHYRVFLDKPIEEPSKYTDLVNALISAGENDMFEFVVSTPGGQLDSCINIINAIRNSDAYTRAVITSDAHSAGSMIALVCDEVVALPHSCMLIHESRGGNFGTYSEQVQSGKFHEKMIAEFFMDVYNGFLTDVEIQEVLNGKDMWLNSEEINLRANKRAELREKEQQKAIREFKKNQKEPKQEKKTSKAVDKVEKTDTIAEEVKQDAGKSILKKLHEKKPVVTEEIS